MSLGDEGTLASMRRLGGRLIDIETPVGPLRVALWVDGWVLAWRREGTETTEEVVDVFARVDADLLPSLVRIGMTDEVAATLAEDLIAMRAVMDADGE
jgi:hypothetical protein